MPSRLRQHFNNLMQSFLEKLDTCHDVSTLECLVDSVEVETLMAVLESVKSDLMNDAKQLISNNLLTLILSSLKWEKLVIKPQLLLKIRDLISVIHDRKALIIKGIGRVIAKIMEKEVENQKYIIARTETNKCVRTCHVIALFLPPTNDRCWYKDITKISRKILSEGSVDVNDTKLLIETFPTLFNICQLPECPIENQVLLLKMICSAVDEKCLESFAAIDYFLSFVRKLMTSIPIVDEKILIGFAILIDMTKYIRIYEKLNFIQLLKSMRQTVSVLTSEKRFEWIWFAYSEMIPHWLNEETISKYQDNKYLSTQIEEIDLIVRGILLDTKGALEDNYCRLKCKLKNILNMPDISSHKGKLSASSEGIEKFRALVIFVVNTVDAILVNNDNITIRGDLFFLFYFLHVPKSPMNIRLGLNKSSSFDRVLGPPKSKEKLFSNPLLRALRLLSIFYEVNENWAILFGYLSTDRLIDRSCYISNVLEEAMNNIRNKKLCKHYFIPFCIIDIATTYPFLLSLENRAFLCTTYVREKMNNLEWKKYNTHKIKKFIIERRRTLNWAVNNLDELGWKFFKTWRFIFSEENGSGIGPTKEFYSEFSKDCQNYEYDLWHGEPCKSQKDGDGILYVNSPLGLFPSPKPSRNPRAKGCLSAIGMVMAKSVVDGHRMDIKFSNAFYKGLFYKRFGNSHDHQILSLVDVKFVMPSIYKFVESLVDALREKWSIESNETLSVEEKVQAMSKIECDGSSFEDLCVNFTLPGYPDVEMEEGGSEVLLSIDNLEKYLKLLTWWVLYKNPQNSIKKVNKGFYYCMGHSYSYLPFFMEYLYPHEYDQIFCGLNKEQWTVEYLKNNSVLDEIDPDAPEVQYLFEVLSSLSASDQRSFLQFATSTPRLPVGGLAALEPKLTIARKWVDENPDDYLPTASTCFNTLFITEYSTKKALEEKLLLAITEGANSFQFV